MAGRTVPFGSFSPDLVITLANELLIDLIGSLEKEVGEEVSGVIRDILAQVDQTFSQVRHNLVHQILADRLRSLVEKVTLVLTDLLEFGSIAFFTLDAILLGVFVKELLLSSFLLGTLVLDLLPLDHRFNFIDLTVRFLVFLGLLGSKQILLLLLSQVLVLHDVNLGLGTILFTRCSNLFLTFLLTTLLFNVIQELVISVSDQI